MLRKFFSFLLIGLIFFLIFSNLVKTNATSESVECFSDEFSSPTLDSRWNWIDPLGDCNYDLTANVGYLRIIVPGDGNDLYLTNLDAPRLMQSIEGDFMVKTHVLVDPQHNAQGAGILVWNDSSNLLRLDRLCDNREQSVDLCGFAAGSWHYLAMATYTLTDVYLILERKGEVFTAKYSNDGSNWLVLGNTSLPTVDPISIGLFVIDQYWDKPGSPIFADFDYFKVDLQPNEWPMFRHDLAHTGYLMSTAPSTNQTLWSYTTDGAIFFASPAVADGRVYVGSSDTNFYALNASTGVLVWSYRTGGQIASSPAVAYNTVYVGSDDGRVYAFGVHDIAIINVTTCKDECQPFPTVGQTCTMDISVTAQNLGGFAENFNVTFYANSAIIKQTQLTLMPETAVVFTFTWTAELPYDNYTISAVADALPLETNTANNIRNGTKVLVTIPGDINGDQWVNAKDAIALGAAFYPFGDYDPNADINNDAFVNAKDAVVLGTHFSESW